MAKRCITLGMDKWLNEDNIKERTWAPLHEDQSHHQGFGPSDIFVVLEI